MASTSPQHPESLQLVSKAIGPLPLLNRFLERLKIQHFFAELVPAGDRRQRLAPAVGLGVMLRNILIARQPDYDGCRNARFSAALGCGPASSFLQTFDPQRISFKSNWLWAVECPAGDPQPHPRMDFWRGTR
jgi:hypothetical protein